MAGEFKDPVPHTGGVLTINNHGDTYSLEYVHGNPTAMGTVELIVEQDKPVEASDFQPDPTRCMVMLPTDSDGMWGRRCPKCQAYFRARTPFTDYCPYCPYHGSWKEFFTEDQLAFIAKQRKAIFGVMHGGDGPTTVDFDAQVKEPSASDWVYAEERQQHQFKCAQCAHRFDVLGLYVRCPECGCLTARVVVRQRWDEIGAAFESDVAGMPKDSPEALRARERRWREHVSSIVAELEAVGRSVTQALAALPAVPKRQKELGGLSFQAIKPTDRNLRQWCGFGLLDLLGQSDAEWLHRMFQRRHLIQHNGGTVDQEYLDKTGDTSVRLNESIRIGSKDVRRMLTLVSEVVATLLNNIDTIEGLHA